MQAKNFTPGSDIVHDGLGNFKGQMVPRVIKTNVGDIYTTNCIGLGNTDGKTAVTYEETIEAGTKLTVGTEGYLVVNAAPEATDMVWQVAKVYTMADGQAAVKLQRIQ